jgi:hypothetical protein
MVHLLTSLTKKDTPFVWSPACQKSFKRLKKSIVSVLVLHQFDPERKIVVEINASNLVVASMLSQYNNDNIFHPMVYFSRKYFPAEINYEIYDKELLVIIHAFKEHCLLLEGSPHNIEVISDH